jgi:hypothetical protein
MIPIPLPTECTENLLNLSWQEVRYGHARKWLGWKDVAKVASKKIQSKAEIGQFEIELSELTKETAWKVSELLDRIASSETPQSNDDIKRKWLFIVLNCLYENKSSYEDPLREVEVVYAEFDYPEEMKSFVRFLPPTDGYRPQDHSKEENIGRIFDLWRKFIEKNRAIYSSQ